MILLNCNYFAVQCGCRWGRIGRSTREFANNRRFGREHDPDCIVLILFCTVFFYEYILAHCHYTDVCLGHIRCRTGSAVLTGPAKDGTFGRCYIDPIRFDCREYIYG